MRWLRPLLAIWLGGCGYGFTAGEAPFGGSRVAVQTFAEWEPLGIAPDIARYLGELAGHEGAQIVFDSATADETITGVIRQGRMAALPVVDPAAAISGYQIVVDIDARVVDKSGTVLWASTMSFSEDFLPGPGNPSQATLGTEASRRRALDRVAQRAAKEIYERITVSSALGMRSVPLQPGKNVPRMSPWSPLPPINAAGAPIWGPQTLEQAASAQAGTPPQAPAAAQSPPTGTTQTTAPGATYAPPQSPTGTPATRVPPPSPTQESDATPH